MNKKNKRTLAKEILYFFSGIFCILVFWGLIEVKNYLINSDIEKISIETLTLTKQLDSLENIKVLDEEWRKKLDSNIFEMQDKGATEDDIKRMVSDFKKRFGKKEIIVKREQLEKAKILSIKNFDDTQDKLIDNTEKNKILTYGLFIIFGLIYPLRLIYYSLIWSIRTLRTDK